MIVVDTSVWIDFFNGHDSAHAARLAAAVSGGEPIGVPGLVLTEVLAGLKTEPQATHIANLLAAFTPLPALDVNGHADAARIYRICRAKGFTIRSTVDCLIAQMCLQNSVALLTKDRDFTSIAACVPLKLVPLVQQ